MRQATAPGKPRRNSARGEEYGQPRWLRVSGGREFRSKRADGRPAALLAFFYHLMLKLTIDSAREGRRHIPVHWSSGSVFPVESQRQRSASEAGSTVPGSDEPCPITPNAQDIAFHGIQAIYLFMRGLHRVSTRPRRDGTSGSQLSTRRA